MENKVDCVMCDKVMDIDDDYVCGESLGEYWCKDCADKETERYKHLKEREK